MQTRTRMERKGGQLRYALDVHEGDRYLTVLSDWLEEPLDREALSRWRSDAQAEFRRVSVPVIEPEPAPAPGRPISSLAMVAEGSWRPPGCAAPLVSIIVRTYGEPRAWLAAAVQSALSQEGVTVEVIVVDDGSQEPVEPFADPRCGLLRLPVNLGLAVARNEGVGRARGEFVRLLDADDELPRQALRRQVDALQEAPDAVAVAGRLEMLYPSPELRRRVTVDGEWCQHAWLREAWDGRPETLRGVLLADSRTLVPGPSILWRRGAAPEVPVDCVVTEDAAWYKQLLAASASPTPLLWLDRTVLHYRVREDSVSGHEPTPAGRLRQQAGLLRATMADRLARHEALARRVTRPQRLAILDWRLECGGAQWALMQIATHLDRRLVRPMFITHEPSPGSDWLERQGVTVHVNPGRLSYGEWVREVMTKERVEVVDVAWASYLADEAVAGSGVATCAHAQSTRLTHAQLTERDPWQRFERILAVSQDVLSQNPHLADRAVVIPSPVDGQRAREAARYREMTRQALGLRPEDMAVIWSGRVAGIEKRTDQLRQIVAACAGTPLRFIVAGHVSGHLPNADAMRADWAAWAAESGAIWLDGVWPWQMPQVYAAGDLYLSTSEIEGMSLALLEAMAAGCVPVVTQVGGVRESVDDGCSGLVVPAGDVGGLTDGLIALARDHHWRGQMAALARHLVVARFDVRESARRHALVYWGEE